MIDCSKECAADPDFALTIPFVEAWEARHGKIEPGNWVLLRTDWSKQDFPDYANLRDDGAHTPGPAPEVVKWLVEAARRPRLRHRDHRHRFRPGPSFQSAVSRRTSTCTAKGRFGLQCLTNLDLLPPTGAVIIAAPLKIKQGSGSPLRVLALVS